jgi:2-polyprenyl-6-hydroxyphenyl methylase/3-demethylubiquinone-9 3-methyltransferase
MGDVLDHHGKGYRYDASGPGCAHGYLLPAVMKVLEASGRGQRIFELGCGSGYVANQLMDTGFQVTAVDPSDDGVSRARAAYPRLDVHQRSAYDNLADEFGTFPLVLSLEVVEHVYFPRQFAATAFELLEPGGMAVISTPYHGYLKNLALALSGKMDAHFTALWDHGHIKFWSIETLSRLLSEAGFSEIEFLRIGRIPPLAKSMIAIARRSR